ncbi:DUF2510 domain-containing protein [Demequina capsici]|uniref:DUF2510 domain-containing protein n=1 Tax=Demequina capsici TaxID=3075620 RepID=A0AA96J8P5_9MICO|nr:DUF2510 domain-containing protein [Demequina sp. OYTSA14]WNM25288.1 DUF2510 domain-containing protein [Demequina sp. OYTSA14]
MTEGPLKAQAGWYTTETELQVRYWDGAEWTDHTLQLPPRAKAPETTSGLGCLGTFGWIIAGVSVLIGLGLLSNGGWSILGGIIFIALPVAGYILINAPILGRKDAEPEAQQEKVSELVTTSPDGNHLAPPPVGEPVEPWGSMRDELEIVGEAYRPDAFRALWDGQLPTNRNGAEFRDVAQIVADFGNPYDSHALAVWVRGQHVGYFDRDTASEWAPYLRDVKRAGGYLEVPARVWAAAREDRVAARVTVRLPNPDELMAANTPPKDGVTLPRGSMIQVTKEEDHMAVLTRYTNGTTLPLAVTLHAIHEIRARSATETVEVRIDGERVGILSPTQSANLLPLVKYVEERGQTAIAHATLKGNSLKADVTLDVLKAQDVPDVWLAALGPKTVDLNRPRRPEYEWDDDSSREERS